MRNETTRLLEDRIAVRPDAPETETEGGIAIPNPAAKGRGTVVACGPGKRVPPRNEIQYMAVKPGDVVLYGRFTGGEVTVGGEPLLLMRECDVVAVVTAEDTLLGLAKSVERRVLHENRGEPHIPDLIPPSPPIDKDNGDSAIRNCGCANSPNCRCRKPDENEYPDCKTMYEACCGRDCDCTHSVLNVEEEHSADCDCSGNIDPVVMRKSESKTGDEDGEGDESDKAAKAGFCTRCRSFGCDCLKHVADETVNAGERLARRAEVDEKTDESKDEPAMNDLDDLDEGTS